MKVYLLDKRKTNYDLVKLMQDSGLESVEYSNTMNIRATKNDFIILITDEEEEVSKSSKLILVTKNKSANYIWKMIHKYHCIDVIDEEQDRQYIANRIVRGVRI